jgi:hypothetical protein
VVTGYRKGRQQQQHLLLRVPSCEYSTASQVRTWLGGHVLLPHTAWQGTGGGRASICCAGDAALVAGVAPGKAAGQAGQPGKKSYQSAGQDEW